MEVVGSYRRGGVGADEVVQRTLPTDVQRLGATPTHGNRVKLGLQADAATAAGSLSADTATGPLLIVASMGTEDRAGDIIDPDGWDLSSYLRNPVFLWAHRREEAPIGRSVRTWVEAGCLKALIEFAPTAEAQSVRTLYAGGYMRGISVGFRPLKWSQRAASNGRRGTHFTRQELLEISAAPVPMHPGALARDVGGGCDALHGVAAGQMHRDGTARDYDAACDPVQGVAAISADHGALARDVGGGSEKEQDAAVIDTDVRDAALGPAALRLRSVEVSEVCQLVASLRRALEALY